MFFESFLLNLSVLVVLIVALVFDYVTKFFSYWYVRHVSYKTPIPFFGSDYHRVLGLTNSTDEVVKLYNEHPGDKFVGRLKNRIPDLIVKDPDAIKRMLSTDFAYFHSRGLGLDKSRDVCIRNNLFYADGEKWTLLRQGLEAVLNGLCREFDIHACLSVANGDTNVQQLLSVVLDSVFDNLLLGDEGTSIKELRTTLQKRSMIVKLKSYLKNIFPSIYVTFGLSTLPNNVLKNTRKYMESSKLQRLIDDSGYMHQVSLKDKHVYASENEFASSTLALFVTEGYIPCLYTLTALFYELAVNPQIQEKARNSIEKDKGVNYLDAIIKETMRLHPSHSIISRQCVKMYQYPESNLTIDRNVTINVPVEAIHKDKEHYENPEVFNPERFLDDQGPTKHSYSYLPFGAGPRKCIGEQLSLRIIKGVTKMILNKYELQTCSKTPSKLAVVDHDFGRVIDKELWLNFKLREF
ncbi:cytochrome P450 6B2-like [Bombyx mandarina]|uniref:unspecific monooxygenase n=1 Tax=Bombyx mandarina TaxID=7092 RepID=A0A6J2JKX6_BOMMA|nr:cytochrome P450 6B2-like [Bombyx mandarina]